MAAAGYRVPVPPGVDPNFGTDGGAPLSEAAPAVGSEVPANPHTHPNMPQPHGSAGDGAQAGIETPAVDAVPA